MEQLISKEEFDEIMNLQGKVRGLSPKSYGEFILKQEGEDGLGKLERAITALGYPIKYREIKSLGFYPLGLEGVTLLAIHRIFNYDSEKIKKIGMFQAKSSLIMRMFMKYFVSIDKVAREVPKMWNKYYTVGKLEVSGYDVKERYLILKLENFRIISLQCYDLAGYFPAVLQMVVGKKVVCEETKCIFKGDEYHEFLMRW